MHVGIMISGGNLEETECIKVGIRIFMYADKWKKLKDVLRPLAFSDILHENVLGIKVAEFYVDIIRTILIFGTKPTLMGLQKKSSL